MMDELLKFREEVQSWKEEKRRHPPVPAHSSKKQKLASKTKWWFRWRWVVRFLHHHWGSMSSSYAVLWCVSWSESWIGPELHNLGPSKSLAKNESVREHCTLPSFAFVSFEGFAVHTYVRSKPDSLSPFPIELKTAKLRHSGRAQSPLSCPFSSISIKIAVAVSMPIWKTFQSC